MHLLLVSMLALGFISGCAGNKAHRTLKPVMGNCTDAHSTSCTASFYQEYPNFDLAFAEFSERGNAFSRPRIKTILGKIRAYAKTNGVVVVVFVHGWKHSAKQRDSNVISFRNTLRQLSAPNGDLIQNRRLIGVYVGWRGASLTIPFLEQLSFWDRKTAAEEVGKGGVTELLLELDQIDRINNDNTDNTLVTVGHSFGGAIVLSALAETLTEKVIAPPDNGSSEPSEISGVGDAVILLNPAIEANQGLTLVEAAIGKTYHPRQAPLLVSISSDADSATHYAFPAGQTVGLLITWSQVDLDRNYYVDRMTQEKLTLKEEPLDSTTVGNFAPFLTHRLEIQGERIDCDTVLGPDLKRKLTFATCETAAEGCRARGFTSTPKYATIKDIPANYPLYFIKTNRTFIKGHNDVFNLSVRGFLIALLGDTMRRSIHGERAPLTILDNPDKLSEAFAQFVTSAHKTECSSR